MHRSRAPGFTLIELMVTIAVLAVMLALAIPSFSDFRQRAAIRGAADQIVSFVGDARFEALRRNGMVKVGVVKNAAGAYCIGAAQTNDAEDDSACDCFDVTPPFACDVALYPTAQSEWRGVRMPSNPGWGGSAADLAGVVVFDPKRGVLTQSGDAGAVSLQSPPGTQDYRLNVAIDLVGRTVACQPSTAPSKLPQYADRPCD